MAIENLLYGRVDVRHLPEGVGAHARGRWGKVSMGQHLESFIAQRVGSQGGAVAAQGASMVLKCGEGVAPQQARGCIVRQLLSTCLCLPSELLSSDTRRAL